MLTSRSKRFAAKIGRFQTKIPGTFDMPFDVMEEMLKAAEEELQLRSDQQAVTQEMLRNTASELTRKEEEVRPFPCPSCWPFLTCARW